MEEDSVTRAEFVNFLKKYEKDTGDIRSLLTSIASKVDSHGASSAVPGASNTNSSEFSLFEGIIPHPNIGRTKKETSFVNVFASIKSGIQTHNESVDEEHKKIKTGELQVPPLSWTHNAMSTVRSIVSKYKNLNSALGFESLDGAKHIPTYRDKPARYNRDVSAVLREITSALPVLILAKSNWAARELLKNTFQNSKAAQKKRAQKRLGADPSNLEKADVGGGNQDKSANNRGKHVVNSGQTQSQKPKKKLMPKRDVTASDMRLHASEEELQPNRESSKKPPIAKSTGNKALRARDCKPIYIDEESDEDRVTARVKNRTNSSLARRKVKAAQKQPKSKRKRANRINSNTAHGRKKRRVNTRKQPEIEEEDSAEEYVSDDGSDESNYAHEEDEYSEEESE